MFPPQATGLPELLISSFPQSQKFDRARHGLLLLSHFPELGLEGRWDREEDKMIPGKWENVGVGKRE